MLTVQHNFERVKFSDPDDVGSVCILCQNSTAEDGNIFQLERQSTCRILLHLHKTGLLRQNLLIRREIRRKDYGDTTKVIGFHFIFHQVFLSQYSNILLGETCEIGEMNQIVSCLLDQEFFLMFCRSSAYNSHALLDYVF